MDSDTSRLQRNNPSLTLSPLLTRQDVATALTTSLRTVDEAIASGDLEIVKIGRSVRVRASALEAFIEARIKPAGWKELSAKNGGVR